MKTQDRDMQSYISIIDSFINQADLEKEQASEIKKELHTYIKTKFEKKEWVHPEITKFCTDWYREFYRLVGNTDPYAKVKNESNIKAQEILNGITATSWQECSAAGIIGNKIDYGACLVHNVDLNEIKKDFEDLNNLRLLIDDTEQLIESLKTANSVLFLVDNDGEIIFDTLLLKKIAGFIPKEKIFIMGKENPMLNDATVEDLRNLSFDNYGTIVSTGSNCFGLHTEDVSEECKELLKNTDLIIAKGQAYLEFFTEYNFRNVFNILRVKHPVKNLALGTLPSSSNAIINSKRYANFGKDYFKQNGTS